MHKLLLLPLLALTGASSFLFAQTPVPAPSAAPKPVATPPGDPFIRDDGAATAAPKTETEPAGIVVNVLTTVETWSLSQTEFVALLDGPGDERAPYDRLEALAKTGKAKLIGLIGINTKPGVRAVVESIDEVRFPTDFDPPQRAGDVPFPVSFETRNVGETLEIDPNVGPDGKSIDINLVPQSVHFEGFQDGDPGLAPIAQPQFRTEKVTTSLSVFTGRPSFLSTATPNTLGEAPGEKLIHVRVLRAGVQPVESVPPFSTAKGVIVNTRAELLIYSLDRDAARRIINGTADSAQSYAAVKELVGKGEAQLEKVSAFTMKSGQRSVNEEITEYRYATQFTSPSHPTATSRREDRVPGSATAFESRNVGVTVEAEVTFGPDAQGVDIAMLPQIVGMAGMLRANGVAANYQSIPLFTTRKLTTNVSSAIGVPILLGTMSHPRDTGVNVRQDDGRTSLAYFRVTAVRP